MNRACGACGPTDASGCRRITRSHFFKRADQIRTMFAPCNMILGDPMAQPNGNDPPRLYPTMRCMDAEAMIAWLKDVLGFVEHVVYRKDGKVVHAELAFGSSILMLGADRDDAYAKRVGDLKGRRTDAVYVAVDDPDALYEKIKAS